MTTTGEDDVNCPMPNGYERWSEADTVTFVRTARRATLQRNGFARFGDFLQCGQAEVVNAHGTRDVVRLELKEEVGPRTVYLKRFGPVHLKDALKDLVRFRRVRTNALVEFGMLCAFREVGLPVPETVAWGERHVLGRDRASFIMVEALPTGRPLDEVLMQLDDAELRCRLIAAVAEFVRRMHDAGLTHTDLFAKHLFVDEGKGGIWSAAVIDLQRARSGRVPSMKERGRDLATLMVSLAPGTTTPRERRTFLLDYLNKPRLDPYDLGFVRKSVLRRARKLSRRTVYRAWQPVLEHK